MILGLQEDVALNGSGAPAFSVPLARSWPSPTPPRASGEATVVPPDVPSHSARTPIVWLGPTTKAINKPVIRPQTAIARMGGRFASALEKFDLDLAPVQ